MYSRYVPPGRAQGSNDPTPEPAISAQPSLDQPVAQPTSMSQPTAYARYVPPSKVPQSTLHQVSVTQHVRFDEEEPPAKRVKAQQDGETALRDADQSTPKKSKKKKDKPVPLNSDVNGLSIVHDDVVEGDEAAIDEKEGETVDSKDIGMQQPSPVEQADRLDTRKRKEKKKKKKHNDAVESQDHVEDVIPLRHKSILEKKAKSLQAVPQLEPDETSTDKVATMADADTSQENMPKVELHGLEPIPQPKPVALDTSIPSYETLPPWLALPTRISPNASAPFVDFGLKPELGISPEVAERLAAKGYKQAFAIQTGVIPLLLPHYCKTMQGDVLVSAATGSGKTLSYALPMVRDISQCSRNSTRLRALIVVPTRELVKQAQQVCEDCAGIFALDGSKRRARIAMAIGSQSFEHEQASLIGREEVYDPTAYRQREKRIARSKGLVHDSDDDDDDFGYNTEDEEREAIRRREDKIKTLPDHVVAYKSNVDILICTPGRLVEHIKFTPGFSLEFVRWLVVDEADKLLGQNFQQWLDVVIPLLHKEGRIGARNHKQTNLSGVRKVILSATMTRDLDQLEGLKLRRPKLVVLEGSRVQDQSSDDPGQIEHVLPEPLEEAALKVSDPNLKPLFLVDLLRSRHILNYDYNHDRNASGDDETSSESSDSDTATSSASSTRSAQPPKRPLKAQSTATVLIFTKSNETTLRLSRLLRLLMPSLEPILGTLTSTTPFTTRRDTLRSFAAGKLRVIVASDLVARGIDLPSLDHVINYDMPSSIASYVHRVGRTARAGNTGKAWTLFTNPEARWFWNDVASKKTIQRSKVVERVRITEEKEDAFNDKVSVYEAALEKLGQEAGQARHNS